MGFKIKNLIIFLAIGILVILFYVFFLKGDASDEALLSSSGAPEAVTSGGESSAIAGNFLTLLLSVRNVNLADAILSDPAFLSLTDSSIELIPEGNEGRPNPFAPFGSDF